MNSIRVELTMDMFEALGSYCSDTRKALSPIQRLGPAAPAINEKLIQAGILNSEQQVVEPFNRLLSNLAKTDVYLDLTWNHSGEQKSLCIYALKTIDPSNLYAPTFANISQSGRVIVQSPFSRQDLEAELQGLLEAGADLDPTLQVGLNAEQAMVLFTLMDLQRQLLAVQEKFKSSGGTAPMENAWNASIALKALQEASDADKPLWVFSVPGRTLIPIKDWNIEDLQKGLDGLVKLGLFSQSGETGYSFSTEMMRIIEHFTVFGNLFWLSVRRAEDENDGLPETEQEHIGYCSQGINLVFSVVENGNLLLRILSRKSLIEMIAKEAYPTALPEWQNQTLPSIRKTAISAIIPEASMPALPREKSIPEQKRETNPPKQQKKKISRKLIAALIAALVFACILVFVGVALVIIVRMKTI